MYCVQIVANKSTLKLNKYIPRLLTKFVFLSSRNLDKMAVVCAIRCCFQLCNILYILCSTKVKHKSMFTTCKSN